MARQRPIGRDGLFDALVLHDDKADTNTRGRQRESALETEQIAELQERKRPRVLRTGR